MRKIIDLIKEKKIIALIFSIVIVVIIIINSTYSLLTKVNETEEQNYTTGILEITSDKVGDSITLTNALPMDDDAGLASDPYTFKIENTGNLTYTFDVKLLSTTTENIINPDYINLSIDGENIIKLTDLNEGLILDDVTLNAQKSIEVSLRMWLNENTPNTEIGKEFNAKITTDGYAVYTEEKVENLDKSGANVPVLTDNLVPVMYNGTTWVTADAENTNETYQWYDYDNKIWANAVLLTETKRNSLTKEENNYTPGQTIGDSEAEGVLAFYVWIPRYKYKVWNIDKEISADSYGAETTGIDIVFEKDTETTGTITCNYDFEVTEGNGLSETCTGLDGDYYTHPAFKFGNDNLSGIWVGKFEISSETPTASYGGGTSTSLTVRTLPNVNSWRYNPVTNFWKVIDDMQVSSNIYGLSTDHTKADTHMLTNMEWGAVAYLTHSKYGRCNGSSCTETAINSYNGFKTGCGPQSSGSTSDGSTCNAYTSTLGLTASTTGNIYGVYDMRGGAYEYVMGNMSSAAGSYTYYASWGGSNFTYNTNNSKYITTYANGSSYYDQTAYNRGRLGDATSEVVTDIDEDYEEGYGWYSDYALFPYSSLSWFMRGGRYNDSAYAGVFDFSYLDGNAGSNRSARSALAVFSA